MRQPGKGANRHAMRRNGAVYLCGGCPFASTNLTDVAAHVSRNQYPVVEVWPPQMGVSEGKKDGRYV